MLHRFTQDGIRNYARNQEMRVGGRYALCRRTVFWRMICEEASGAPIGLYRRYSLIRYAVSLGLPLTEARLMVRAADSTATRFAETDGRWDCLEARRDWPLPRTRLTPVCITIFGLVAAAAEGWFLFQLLR